MRMPDRRRRCVISHSGRRKTRLEEERGDLEASRRRRGPKPGAERTTADLVHNYNRGMAANDPQPNEPVEHSTGDADVTMVLDPGATGPEPHRTVQTPPPDLSDIPEYALVVHKGQQAGRTWLLSPGVTRVGRHPYSDIALDHITVSRRHCRIELDSRGLSLRDLGSTNGSYVNDRLVEESSLSPGDRLMIGTFHLLVARGQ